MAFENLPGVFSKKIDGNLVVNEVNKDPIVLILGTSPSGPSETLHTVISATDSAKTFGKTDGTLVRGMYEAIAGGAKNLRLYRLGAEQAVLSGIGSDATSSVTIKTVLKDAGIGFNYKIFWDASDVRLYVYRVSDDELVYDNNPAYPDAAIDLGEVEVSGTFATGTADIGTSTVPVVMALAGGTAGATYTAGSDGILLSRMELYEELFKAYKLLENEKFDHVVPMNAFLDDLNVSDMTTAQVTTLNTGAAWASSSTYPTPGDSDDALGYVFAQEYQGQWYFWWDMDRDGIAEIYPSVGSASALLDANGTAITEYHHVNFAYQLADFCFRQSENQQEMIGFIGVLPPVSFSLKDISNWIGTEPTTAEDASGNLVVTVNGTGLLGNRWMAGRIASSGKPAHIVDGIAGLADGGFIATDDGWMDGTQQKDRQDRLVDIGKYIEVVGSQVILANPTSDTSYVASASSVFAGLVSTLPGNTGGTAELVPGVRIPYRIGVAKIDLLAGKRYIMFHKGSNGIEVADAPTAARPDSDFRRLSTVRIVKSVIDGLRAVAKPFIGKPLGGGRLAALDTAIESSLQRFKKAEFITRSDKKIVMTPTQHIQGKADLELTLVPMFELRQLTIYTSLAAQ